jgi:hypothetical protein
MDRE